VDLYVASFDRRSLLDHSVAEDGSRRCVIADDIVVFDGGEVCDLRQFALRLAVLKVGQMGAMNVGQVGDVRQVQMGAMEVKVERRMVVVTILVLFDMMVVLKMFLVVVGADSAGASITRVVMVMDMVIVGMMIMVVVMTGGVIMGGMIDVPIRDDGSLVSERVFLVVR